MVDFCSKKRSRKRDALRNSQKERGEKNPLYAAWVERESKQKADDLTAAKKATKVLHASDNEKKATRKKRTQGVEEQRRESGRAGSARYASESRRYTGGTQGK
jgi:hypothetical protein